MSDFPNPLPFGAPIASISPINLCSPLGSYTACLASGGLIAASSVVATANVAYYLPFVVPTRVIAKQLWWENGSAVSGNVDMGIYDVNGTRIISTGSTAQAGTSTFQLVNITDTELMPGNYYFALVIDNTTGAFLRFQLTGLEHHRLLGQQHQATAFPLPSTAAFANPSGTAYWPSCGATIAATL